MDPRLAILGHHNFKFRPVYSLTVTTPGTEPVAEAAAALAAGSIIFREADEEDWLFSLSPTNLRSGSFNQVTLVCACGAKIY